MLRIGELAAAKLKPRTRSIARPLNSVFRIIGAGRRSIPPSSGELNPNETDAVHAAAASH